MPRVPHRKTETDRWSFRVSGRPAPAKRFFKLNGFRHLPEWPTANPLNPVDRLLVSLNQDMDWRAPQYPGWDPRIDVTSVLGYQAFTKLDQRLYSSVYSAALQKARDGAELGLNIVQYKQSLTTFTGLLLTASTVVSAFAQANKAGLNALKRRPSLTLAKARAEINQKHKVLAKLNARSRSEADRIRRQRGRIMNEIYVLNTICGTLLAYRYGVAPIMSDLFKAHEVLTRPIEEPEFVRKGGSRAWKHPPLNSWFRETWTGEQRCSVRFTAKVDNLNLFLANKLGLINPIYWAWDSTPWSFVVDWWFPVGNFVNNLTAGVGLVFTDVAVTATTTGELSLTCDFGDGYVKSGTGFVTSKIRTTSGHSLPPPVAVGYGTGIGLNRAQNAAALIVQNLSLQRRLSK